ncbi:Peptide-methionine (R)-S-oxide reductase [Aphelenchoides fujianensis]|nr:Peptide-methionine (R)-S-oxide reductase [Aphelenchoides fujianensis]
MSLNQSSLLSSIAFFLLQSPSSTMADESRLPKGPVVSRPAVYEDSFLSERYDDPARVPEEVWRAVLTPEEYYVCRLGGTEPQYCGILTKFFGEGTYTCRCCGVELFGSENKYWAGVGMPTFHSSLGEDRNIIRTLDTRFGLNRVEAKCKQCNAHLGHIFEDDLPESGERYCINSTAIGFVKEN